MDAQGWRLLGALHFEDWYKFSQILEHEEFKIQDLGAYSISLPKSFRHFVGHHTQVEFRFDTRIIGGLGTWSN